jgi:hypothetical protein
MNAHKVETTINENGQLVLTGLPFKPGDAVEVIVLERPLAHSEVNVYPLKDKQPYRYDDPFEPAVSPEEWEVEV